MRKHGYFVLALAGICLIAAVAVYGFDVSAVHAGLGAVMIADASGTATLEKQITDLGKELTKAADLVKENGEKAMTEIATLKGLQQETKSKGDELLVKHNDISVRMTDLEQALAKLKTGNTPVARKSVGTQFVEDEEVKTHLGKGWSKGRVRAKVKAIISSLTTDADGSAGDLIVPQRLPGIIGPAQRRMTVRDLLTPGATASNAIQYVKETGFTNAAATVSETAGDTKPQSNIKFDIVTTSVTTIAHWVLATRQILDDVPQLRSYIDGRLTYGLEYKEELQLLLGDGNGTNLNGIYTQATAYSAPINPTAAGVLTKVDVIRLAILQAFLAELPPTGIVMNPSDWTDIELTKTEDGAYIFASPQSGTQPRLWGKPVVETQAMSVDTFMTGAFQQGAQIFDREEAHVEISTEDSDNFRKNLATILAEQRLALAVYRPEAFIKGSFTTALAA